LKPGIGWQQKIKFHGRKIGIAFAVSTLVLSILACSQSYVSPYDLTATALFSPGGAGGAEITPPPTEQPTDSIQPVDTAVVQPSPDTNPTIPPTVTVTQDPASTPPPPVLYYTQAGDTLQTVAYRFGVPQEEITSNESFPVTGFIPAGKLLIIPNRLGETGPTDLLLPDSEIVFSPSALDFDIEAFVNNAGGYLSTYKEYMADGWTSGAQIVRKVSVENSINPRILLALIEYQSQWVFGKPDNLAKTDYPVGWVHLDRKGLYKQLAWAVQQLSIGYYGWRDGILVDVFFPDNENLRLAPSLNAGSVGVQHLFSKLYNRLLWNGVLSGESSFSALYGSMFDDPWLRAQTVEPLLPINLTQPDMILPFLPGHVWSYTGGPHSAWGPDGARAALDFAPSSIDPGCSTSDEWITAVANGLVVRTGTGIVVLDLDGDGYEQTGWVILYLHVASRDRVKEGTWVSQGDLIGHPSCEGGAATGTHVHIARKYNGEWVLAGGPLPMMLNGWTAQAGSKPYEGNLVKGDDIIEACTCGSYETRIGRPSDGS
jgi:LasA protease